MRGGNCMRGKRSGRHSEEKRPGDGGEDLAN